MTHSEFQTTLKSDPELMDIISQNSLRITEEVDIAYSTLRYHVRGLTRTNNESNSRVRRSILNAVYAIRDGKEETVT